MLAVAIVIIFAVRFKNNNSTADTKEISFGASTNHTVSYLFQITMKTRSASDDDVPNLLGFQSISSSESGCGFDDLLTSVSYEGILKSPRHETASSNCEINFGDVLPEDDDIDIVKNAVFGVASSLLEFVGMRKTQLQDDELSNNTSSVSQKTNGLDTEGESFWNVDYMRQRHDSLDSISIPPEIEMLHRGADHILESIRNEASSRRVSLDSSNKSREELNHFLNREAVENLLNRKYNNFDNIEDQDATTSVSSYLTDNDGMVGEIQNLGMAVSNLRHDIENLEGCNDCDSSAEMPEASMLDAKRSRLRETWSRAFEDIVLSIKNLRRLGDTHVSNNSSEKSLEGRSRMRDTVYDWSSTILVSATVIMAGSYLRASFSSENGFNERESFDMLENLEWMFARKEQHELP